MRTIPRALLLLALQGFLLPAPLRAQEQPQAAPVREESVALRAELTRGLLDAQLLPAESLNRSIGTVPRHRFISGPPQAMAYQNSPAPLGRGLFIPSPEEYALMLAAAGNLSDKRVLVAGPESGYLTALVSRLAVSVVQLEFVPSRAGEFRALYEELGYGNIEVRSGRERILQESTERYDVILLAYATETIPLQLTARLSQTGFLLAVLSYRGGEQLLTEYSRSRNAASIRVVGRVFFPAGEQRFGE